MSVIIRELLILLKTGGIDNVNLSRLNHVKTLIYIFIISTVMVICSFFIIAMTYYILDWRIPTNYLLTETKTQGIWYLFLVSNIISPIIEEIRHRVCLRYSSLNFSLMLGAWFYFIFGYIYKGNERFFWENNFFTYRISVSFFLIILLYKLLGRYGKINIRLKNLWINYKKSIFYFFIISFGFIHITNFPINTNTLIMTPIITLPQTFLGLMLGYTRLKYGIIYSILMHTLFNLIPHIEYLF